MRIWLNPELMKQHNLMPSDVTGVLSEQNIEAAPGKFGEQSNQSFEYVMRYKGRLKTPQNLVTSSLTLINLVMSYD
jgi:HAE1 family hydrophobic/amphiphilic exporter-1